MRQSEIDSIASDISNLVINRVLSGELSITEALVGILTSPIFVCAKTLPTEKTTRIMDDGEELARSIALELEETSVSPAALVYGLSVLGRAMIENTQK